MEFKLTSDILCLINLSKKLLKYKIFILDFMDQNLN